MIRRVIAVFVILLACVLVWLFFFAPPQRLAARFSHDDCRRVALIDRTTGRSIVGIEDVATVPGDERIILSAHDRKDFGLPDGGLYAVTLFLLSSGGQLKLSNLVDLGARDDIFRPHGIAVSHDGQRLGLINRVGEGTAQIEVGPLDADGWRLDTRVHGKSLCRANDLEFDHEQGSDLSLTIDRGDCFASLDDTMPGATTGRVVAYRDERLQDVRGDLSFPNGLSAGWIAETRRQRLVSLDGREIGLPGGPDNLNPVEDGALVAALHPKLAQLWLYFEGWADRAPSRLVRIDPLLGDVEVLFDDPRGVVFSAATSAVLVDDHLIAGSAHDKGLLFCEPRS